MILLVGFVDEELFRKRYCFGIAFLKVILCAEEVCDVRLVDISLQFICTIACALRSNLNAQREVVRASLVVVECVAANSKRGDVGASHDLGVFICPQLTDDIVSFLLSHVSPSGDKVSAKDGLDLGVRIVIDDPRRCEQLLIVEFNLTVKISAHAKRWQKRPQGHIIAFHTLESQVASTHSRVKLGVEYPSVELDEYESSEEDGSDD